MLRKRARRTEIVRRTHDAGSASCIAEALGISKGVVAKYASLAAAAGLDWPTVQGLGETAMERHMVGGAAPLLANPICLPSL